MTDQPRVLAGRYRVDELIGQGGMASVHRGYDLTLGRTVAIKILSSELARDMAFRARFRLEAQAASRMSNPTIVRVFDAGEDSSEGEQPVPFIVMELVEGRTLKKVLAEGPVPLAEALGYVDGILEALEYSHRAGVIHRDIKPGNVMITAAGTVKVMDFGIARAVSDSSSTVAETTQIIGTASYFSPEQAKGESVDARTDLYSAGVVLYELLTGRPPFRGETPVAVAYQHVSEAPEPPSEVLSTVPSALDAVVLRALAKDPYARFPDAASFRAALKAAAAGKAVGGSALDQLNNELYGPNPREAVETARSLRQLGATTSTVRTQQGPPVTWIWSGVAVLAVLLIAVLFWVVNIRPSGPDPANVRTVPDVTGIPYARAEEMLRGHQLEAVRKDETNAAVQEGLVVRTEPGAEQTVQTGSQVTVYVSRGAEKAKVPVLQGLSETDATNALKGAKLTLGLINKQNSPDVARGVVLSSSPQTGDEVAVGSVVNLVVASGQVVIRDYTGFTVESAEKELTGETLRLEVKRQEDATCKATDPLTVKSQSAPPGEVAIHSVVTLTYCSGK